MVWIIDTDRGMGWEVTLKTIPILDFQFLGFLTSKWIKVRQLFKRKKMVVYLSKSVDFWWNDIRSAVFPWEQLWLDGIFGALMEHVHDIAIMSMLDDILTKHYIWMNSFVPWTLVHLMISKHSAGVRNDPRTCVGGQNWPQEPFYVIRNPQ